MRASVAKPLQFIRSRRQLTGLPRNKISLVRFDPVVGLRWLTPRKSTGILRGRSPSVAGQILQSGRNKNLRGGNKNVLPLVSMTINRRVYIGRLILFFKKVYHEIRNVIKCRIIKWDEY